MEISTSVRHSIALPVTEASQVGDVRRLAARLATECGFDEVERGSVSLIVTELGNNLAKYASDGQIVLRLLADEAHAGIEILSLDSGPGFSDIGKRVADGYSSAGTPGNGIGAVKRMSSEFDIYSSPGLGTAILARVSRELPQESRSPGFEFGVVSVPIGGEEKCGDSWGVFQDENRALFAVVDGLGHGAIAAEAGDEAVRVFHDHTSDSSVDIVSRTHLALRSTRGAVMAITEAQLDGVDVEFTGVGNISGSIFDGASVQRMISVNGTLGLAAKPRAFSYSWDPDGVLIMHSDGLHSRWQLDKFPALLRRHPSIIAGFLYQHYCRGRDDVTVLVARRNQR
jgi:anti-sigma regulatory factor (Ser/Thr protein kinase)